MKVTIDIRVPLARAEGAMGAPGNLLTLGDVRSPAVPSAANPLELPPSRAALIDALVEGMKRVPVKDREVILSRVLEFSSSDGVEVARKVGISGDNLMRALVAPNVVNKHEKLLRAIVQASCPRGQATEADKKAVAARYDTLGQYLKGSEQDRYQLPEGRTKIDLRLSHPRADELLDLVDRFYATLLEGRTIEPGYVNRISNGTLSKAGQFLERIQRALRQECPVEFVVTSLLREFARTKPDKLRHAIRVVLQCSADDSNKSLDVDTFMRTITDLSYRAKLTHVASYESRRLVLEFHLLKSGFYEKSSLPIDKTIPLPELFSALEATGNSVGERCKKELREATKITDLLFHTEKKELLRRIRAEVSSSAGMRYGRSGAFQVQFDRNTQTHSLKDTRENPARVVSTVAAPEKNLLSIKYSRNHIFYVLDLGASNGRRSILIQRDDRASFCKISCAAQEFDTLTTQLICTDNPLYPVMGTEKATPNKIERVYSGSEQPLDSSSNDSRAIFMGNGCRMVLDHPTHPVLHSSTMQILIGIGEDGLYHSPYIKSRIASCHFGQNDKSYHLVELSSGERALWEFDGAIFKTLVSGKHITDLMVIQGKLRFECLNHESHRREYWERLNTGEFYMVREIDPNTKLIGNNVLKPQLSPNPDLPVYAEYRGLAHRINATPAWVALEGSQVAVVSGAFNQERVTIFSQGVATDSPWVGEVREVYAVGNAIFVIYESLNPGNVVLISPDRFFSAFHNPRYPTVSLPLSLLIYRDGGWTNQTGEHYVYALKLPSDDTVIFANDVTTNRTTIYREVNGAVKESHAARSDLVPVKWREYEGILYVRCRTAEGAMVCIRERENDSTFVTRHDVLDFTCFGENILWLTANELRASKSKTPILSGLINPVMTETEERILIESGEKGHRVIHHVAREIVAKPSTNERIGLAILDAIEVPTLERVERALSLIKQRFPEEFGGRTLAPADTFLARVVQEIFESDQGAALQHLIVDRDDLSESFINEMKKLLYPERVKLEKDEPRANFATILKDLLSALVRRTPRGRTARSADGSNISAGAEELSQHFGNPIESWTAAGADPREQGKTLITSRQSLNHFFVSGIFGEYKDGAWQRIHFPIPANDTRTQLGEYTLSIETSGDAMTLHFPALLGGFVLKDRIKAVTSDGTEIFLEALEAKESVAVSIPVGTKRVLYSVAAPPLPPGPHTVTAKEFEHFVAGFKKERGEVLSRRFVPLRPEWRLFLRSIESLEPQEKLKRVIQYAEHILYYDCDFGEWQAEANSTPLPELFDLMRKRMNSIREESKGSAGKLQTKELAGVCAHIAAFTTAALLREAGFLSGVMAGYVAKGTTVQTSDAHAMPYVLWPSKQGKSFSLIPMDVAPTQGTREAINFLDHFKIMGNFDDASTTGSSEELSDQSKLPFGPEVIAARSSVEETASNGVLEDLVNEVQRAQWPENEVRWCREIFEAACFSGQGVIANGTVAKEKVESYVELLRDRRQWYDGRENLTGENYVLGSELFDLILEQEAYLSKIIGTRREALKVMQQLLQEASPFIPHSIQRATQLMVRYLLAEKMQ